MHKILKQLAWIFLILGILIPSNGLSEKVTIRYLTFETSYQQINLIKKIIAEFERRHPDIHVQLEATTEASQIFLTDMAAGTPPDVMYITTEYLSQLVDKNALIPMNAWISRDTVDMNIFFPETVQYLTFHQKLYAYPIHYSTHALFYNKHLFDKAHIPYPDENWTWDDYKNAAHKLTSKNPQTGRVEIWGTLNPDYRLIILSKGGKIFTDDATQCIIDSPVGEKAVAWATSMIGIDTPTASQIQDTNDMQMFANEKLAMFIGRTWELPQISRTMEKIPWDIAPVPKGETRFSTLAIGGHCIARGSRHPEAAWEYVKFYSSLDGQKLLGVQKNCVPALIPLAQDTNYFLCAPPQHINVFLEAITYSKRDIPDTPWHSEFLTKIWDPTNEKIVAKVFAPAQGLKYIQEETNKLIAQYKQEDLEKSKIASTTDTTAFLFNFMLILMGVGFLVMLFVAGTNRKYWEGYIFISPWLIGFLIFTFGPVLASLYLSFTKYDLLNSPKWIGLDNFRNLLHDPLFHTSIINTLYYSAFTVPLTLIGALLLAMMLNNKIRGMYTFRAIYYLPAITSGVAISLLWRWIFNPDLGLMNSILGTVGIHGPDWLTSPHWAMPAIIIMSVWGALGGPMLIYLAGLQGIPEQLYEASELDGASRWQQFRNVTIPMLSPTIFFNFIIAIINSFQVFATIYVMTSNLATSIEPGGPVNSTLVYVLYLYRTGFRYLTMGKACAMAWVLFLLILGLTLLNFRLSKKWVHYDQI